jgi:hypothetical protein
LELHLYKYQLYLQLCQAEKWRYIPRVAVGGGADMVKSARLIASGKEGLTKLLLEHIIPRSVVAVGNIEQISEPLSRFITNGQQMVASPIVAASKGTGMI